MNLYLETNRKGLNSFKFLDSKLNDSFIKIQNEYKVQFTRSAEDTITFAKEYDEILVDDLKCQIRNSVFTTKWQCFSLPKDSPKKWNDRLINHLQDNKIPFTEEIENGEYTTFTPLSFEIPDYIYTED